MNILDKARNYGKIVLTGAALTLASCNKDLIEDLQDQTAQLTQKTEAQQKEIEALQQKDQNVDEMFERLFNAMDQHSTEVYTQLMLIMNYISDLQEKVKEVENMAERDEKNLEALREEIDYLEEKMRNVKGRIDSLVEDHWDLEDKVDGVATELNEKTYDHQDVAMLKEKVAEITKKRQAVMLGWIDVTVSNNERLDALDSTTTSHDERISALENNAETSDASDSQESHESTYSPEIVEAYQWAREHGLTSSYSIEKAKVFESMSRLSFFKSINMFAKEYQLNTVEFNEESQGNMDKLEGYVMLAKMLYGDLEIPEGDPGYKVYLNKLKADGIITITDPDKLTGSFIRGYLRILLKRIVEQKGLDTTHS